MKFLSTLLIATSLISVHSFVLPEKPRKFRLRAGADAPAVIKGAGFVDRHLGFSKKPQRPYVAYIKPYGDPAQKGWGKCIDASSPKDILWLRPTHGSPMYFVLNGDPQTDAVPQLTLWDSWNVRKGADGKNYLAYFDTIRNWQVCDGQVSGDWNLYWGPQIGDGTGRCSTTFSLEVVYV